MKTRASVMFLGLIVILLSSCGGMREGVLKLSDENKKNFAAADQLAIDLGEIWPQLSGVYKASENVLSKELIDRVRKIDKIFLDKNNRPVDVTTISKRDRAIAGTHFLFLTSKSVKLIYKELAPDVFNLLRILGL